MEVQKNYTKSEVILLMDKRKALEGELVGWLSVLESQQVGMEDALVDEDNFPRNDIDVYKVREARHKIIVLRNDLKELTKEIETGLLNIHEQSREGLGISDPLEYSQKVEGVIQGVPAIPFVEIDQVSEESPAFVAGLQVGDMIVEFGTLKSDNFTNLASLATVAELCKNENMRVKVIRNGNVKTLLLKPKTWSGRGLLGCHVRPIEAKPDR